MHFGSVYDLNSFFTTEITEEKEEIHFCHG